MNRQTFLLSVLLGLATAAASSAQSCPGPTTGFPQIGQTTSPPGSSGAINVSYNGQFSVSRSGVYEISGTVTLGKGAGAPVDFTHVQASVNGQVVMDETPPPIAGPNPLPNGWTYNWSIYFYTINKPYQLRMYLDETQTYTFAVSARGSYQVLSPWHRRNYSATMSGQATYCGPAASVQSVGTGCVGANPPTLQALAPPVLGQTRDVMITGQPGSPAAVLMGLPSTLSPTYIGAGCSVYVDLAGPLLALSAPLGASGTGFALFSIPPDPALASVRLGAQGLVASATSPLGFDLTNGLVLTLGY